MPRLVKIEHITYKSFNKLRNILLKYVPWAIRNDIFEDKSKTAYIMFEDSDYIPDILIDFVVNPPFDKTALNEEFKEFLFQEE